MNTFKLRARAVVALSLLVVLFLGTVQPVHAASLSLDSIIDILSEMSANSKAWNKTHEPHKGVDPRPKEHDQCDALAQANQDLGARLNSGGCEATYNSTTGRWTITFDQLRDYAMDIVYEMIDNGNAWFTAKADGDIATCNYLAAQNDALASKIRYIGGSASRNSDGEWTIKLPNGDTFQTKSNGKTGHGQEIVGVGETVEGEQVKTEEHGTHYYEEAIDQYEKSWYEEHGDEYDSEEARRDAFNDALLDAYNNEAIEMSKDGVDENNSDLTSALAEIEVLKQVKGLSDEEAKRLQERLEDVKSDYKDAFDERTQLKSDLAGLREQLAAAEARLAELEEEMSKLLAKEPKTADDELQIELLQALIEEQKGFIAELLGAIQELIGEESAAELEKLIQELSDLKRVEPQTQEIKDRIEELEKLIQNLQATGGEIGELTNELNDLHDEAENLRGSYGYTGDGNSEEAENGAFIVIEDKTWEEMPVPDIPSVYYNIEVAYEGPGVAMPAGTISRRAGSDVMIYLYPDAEASDFVQITIDDGTPFYYQVPEDLEGYKIENLSKDTKIHIKFMRKTQMPEMVKVYAYSTEGGSISPSGEFWVEKGSNIDFTITAWPTEYSEDGRIKREWRNQNVVVNADTKNAKYTPLKNEVYVWVFRLTNIQAKNTTVKATFKSIDFQRHIVTTTAGEGGSIDPAGITWVEDGGSFRYTAAADNGYIINTMAIDDIEFYRTPVDTGGNALTKTSGNISGIFSDTAVHVTFRPAPGYCLVKFDLQGIGGPQPPDQSILLGDYVTRPQEPTADGYTFGGWYYEVYDEDTGETKWEPWLFDTYTVSADMLNDEKELILHAKWIEKDPTTHTVKFDLQNIGGDKPADQTVVHGEKATEPTEPSSDSHDFGGWFKEAECTNAWDFENDTVTEDMTLYAKWGKKTSSEDPTGGGTEEPDPDPEDPTGGGTEEPDPDPEDPTGGGTEEPDPDPEDPTGGGTEEPESYTITWVDGDGNVLEVDEDVPKGSMPSYDGNTPTKTPTAQYSYEWTEGWTPEVTEVTGDATYVATFTGTLNAYTVHFDLQGIGSPQPDDQTVSYGGMFTPPAVPSSDTHDFGGWFKEAECTNAWHFGTDTVTEDITLYAKWTKKAPTTHTVKFDLQNIGGDKPADQAVVHGEKATEPKAPTSDSHDFGGWFKEAACTNAWDFENDTVTQDTTLYAKWTIKTYTVKFIGGGSGIPDQVVPYGSKITKPADPTKDGYVFVGWFKDPGYIDDWDFETDTVPGGIANDDRVIYLHGKQTIKTYTVKFDLQDIGGDKPGDQTVIHGGHVTEPTKTPTSDTYDFDGWYTDKACTNAWDFVNDTVTKNMTLYAKWTVNTVKFDLQGIGSPQPATQYVKDGHKVPKPTDPSAEGYTFLGWYTYKEDGSSFYWDFTNYAVYNDMTLYAHWSKHPDVGSITGIVVTPSGDGSTIKSGYGIGLELTIEFEFENPDDAKKLNVTAYNTGTKREFDLEPVDGKWVLPENSASNLKEKPRVDYLPVDLPDGKYQFDVTVSFDGKVIATYKVEYEVKGVMYDDDFTGDRE